MNKRLKRVLQNAVYAAMYVALCFVFQPISFAAIQVRIAEALCILALFDDMAVVSVSIGCFIANILLSGIIDAIFGSFATFFGMYLIKYIKTDNFFLKMLPTVLSNAFIIPFVLRIAFGETMPIYLLMITIAIGEVVSIHGIGYALYNALLKTNLFPTKKRFKILWWR